jgi:hypothetical protein
MGARQFTTKTPETIALLSPGGNHSTAMGHLEIDVMAQYK